MSLYVPAPGSRRVDRGGGWLGGPQFARVANRFSDAPVTRRKVLGVRLIRRCP